jgi:hypothetical protein
MTEEGNDIGTPEEAPAPEPKKEPKPASDRWSSVEQIVYQLGRFAWIIEIISGVVLIILAIYGFAVSASLWWLGGLAIADDVWYLISGIIAIILGFFIIRPKFSNKCAEKDWDFLLNDVILLGNFRFPKMLLWGILAEIFGYGWGGLAILIPAFLLLFMGPKPYNWKKE